MPKLNHGSDSASPYNKVTHHPDGPNASMQDEHEDYKTSAPPAACHYFTVVDPPTTPTDASRDEEEGPQYQYLEDPSIVARRIFDKIMDGYITIQVRDLLAVSEDLRKLLAEECGASTTESTSSSSTSTGTTTKRTPATAATNHPAVAPDIVSLREVEISIQGRHTVHGVYATGAEMVCINLELVQKLGLAYNTIKNVITCGVLGTIKRPYGLIPELELCVSGISISVPALILENVPYQLLLGRPFQTRGRIECINAGEILLIKDPKDESRLRRVTTRARIGKPGVVECFTLFVMNEKDYERRMGIKS